MNEEFYDQIVQQLDLPNLVKPLLDECVQAYIDRQVKNTFQSITDGNPVMEAKVTEWLRQSIKKAIKDNSNGYPAFCRKLKEIAFKILFAECSIFIETKES